MLRCPICAQALEGGALVMVCNFCHKSLGTGIGLNVGATGEFNAPSSEMIDEIVAGELGEKISATNVCSWCGKLEAEVKKLLGRAGTALCNECVGLACSIMDAELGEGWR